MTIILYHTLISFYYYSSRIVKTTGTVGTALLKSMSMKRGLMSYRSSPKLISCFCPLRIFKSDCLIQALISRKIMDENIIPISIAETSFSFYPKFNFLEFKFVSLENKNFLTNNKKKSGSQNLRLEFLKFLEKQLLRLFESHKNHKNS